VTERVIPSEWIGKDVILIAAGAPQDTEHTGRLEAVGSDGCVLNVADSAHAPVRFFPWQSVRRVMLKR
jgi:hypothetical protein